ncbi:hypothetical protein GMST_15500 [Geomonas silvestris]|uniref:DUF2188 domain-containing protein n=1 Tax=Geomonas silvestris TaxID=2740184 RepID=A0A6V8MGX8_9BACT|nr:DUF2188 domain-containing protein [Geomonas silvestris]GFO59225.1 hypothetical protein GMST_15500 [Geomonas silvestris]
MTKRKVVHVVPDKKQGGWNVEVEKQQGKKHFETKDDAVGAGKKIAKEGPLGQIKIHKQDGTIQTEHTYGEDPKNILG